MNWINWKFWEWESLKEDEFPCTAPVTEDQHVIVDTAETPTTNPEADRIRKQLLASRK